MFRAFFDAPTMVPEGSRIGETVREIGTSLPSLHFRIVSKCSMALATANVRKHHILFGKTIGRDRLAVSQARLIGVVRSCLVSHVISHHRRRARAGPRQPRP